MINIYLDPWVLEAPLPILDRERVSALVEAAHDGGVLVRAHVRTAPELVVALDGGVDVIEHPPVGRLTEPELAALAAAEESGARMEEIVAEQMAAAEPLLERMVEDVVALVPTLASYADYLVYLLPEPARAPYVEAVVGLAGRINEIGGVVALGTDRGFVEVSGNHYLAEMALLRDAGLTPLEAIQSATANAAAVCGQEEELGSLEVGKLADLIVVDGDPLADLGALERVENVILGGEIVFSRAVPSGG